GNGTQDILTQHPRPNVLFISLHVFAEGFYPGSGGDHDYARNIYNFPIHPMWTHAKDKGSAAFRAKVTQVVLPLLRAFGPDLILVSAGFDGCHHDIGNKQYGQRDGPVGMDLSPGDFHWVTTQLMLMANLCCNGRLVSVLEGGYGRVRTEHDDKDDTSPNGAVAASPDGSQPGTSPEDNHATTAPLILDTLQASAHAHLQALTCQSYVEPPPVKTRTRHFMNDKEKEKQNKAEAAQRVRQARIADAQKVAKAKAGNSGGVIRFKTTFRNTIFDAMLRRGWKESDTDWDFYWADREFIYDVLDSVHLDVSQKVNHFRNGRELCRKDLLIKNLKRARRAQKKNEEFPYDFFPITYILPGEYSMFVEVYPPDKLVLRTAHLCSTIFVGSCVNHIRAQGKGIFLFTKLSQISDWRTDYRYKQPENQQVETYVVQKYISNPYLVGGKKFDLRLYALVTSFAPLEMYLYRSGFARFTNSRYSNNASDIENSFIHLTNVAIQKTSDKYDKKHGGKWDLKSLKLYMMSHHGVARVDHLFYQIQMVIIRSLQR
ncbi:hypothetical protein DYB36_010177, partial [Aphanomyces astaci]